MKNIRYSIVPSDEAADVILEIYESEIFVDEIQDAHLLKIETDLINFFTEKLQDDLFFIIEYPYVDKVYRDSYYNYFSSKHYSYKRDSIRVSIFNTEINSAHFFHEKNSDFFKDNYFGFLILRPIKSAIFGRSHINPRAFNKKIEICSYSASSMVMGVKLKSPGFPHSSQDFETISCAETTIWGLMEYFGTKYAEYTPTLPSKIISTLKSLSFERQLPSNGLSIDQISFALKEFGFGTMIYAEKSLKGKLNNVINHYLESGIPIVLSLHSKNLDHAVIAIGKNKNKFDSETHYPKETIEIDDEEISFIDYASTNNKIIIQDDNHSPYLEVDINYIGEYYEEGTIARDYEVDFLIVPLYPKIYLEATVAKEKFIQFLTLDGLGYKFKNNFVFRMYLASNRSFKSHISRLTDMPDDLKIPLISTKMPKFIWCAEFYEGSDINENTTSSGLLILDATEANQLDIDALIFAGYPDRCILLAENNYVILDTQFIGFKFFTNLNRF